MLTDRDQRTATNTANENSTIVFQQLKSNSVENGVHVLIANNSSSTVVNKQNQNQSMFTSVNLTSSTQSDALHDEQTSQMQVPIPQGELMQINEESLSINQDSRIGQYAQGAGHTANFVPQPPQNQLLSSRNWNKLDPSFFEQKTRYNRNNRVGMNQLSVDGGVSDKMTAQTARQSQISGGQIKRADLFVKGSPTINPDLKYGVEQDHNFMIGPKRHHQQELMSNRLIKRNQMTQGQARQHHQHSNKKD